MDRRLFCCVECGKHIHWIDGPVCDSCHRESLARQYVVDVSKAALAREREKKCIGGTGALEEDEILTPETRVFCDRCLTRSPTSHKNQEPACPPCSQKPTEPERESKEKTSKKGWKHSGRRHAN